MTPGQRREARLALAMLPVGAATLVVSGLALIAVAALAVFAAVRGGGWYLGWAAVAALIAGWNAVAGIAIMSAFDWRPAPLVLLRSGAIVAAWPGWWLP